MIDTSQESRPDHDAELTICGAVYLFRRSHDLLRRLEQRFGALIPLARRVEGMSITQADVAGIYEEIVRGDPKRPMRLDLELWVWNEGTPKLSTPLARVLYELPIGNRTLRLLEEEKRIARAEQVEREESVRPTSPADGPAQQRMQDILAKAFPPAT